MKRTNIFMTEAQLAKLAKLKKVTGLSVGEQVRRAVDEYLKSKPK